MKNFKNPSSEEQCYYIVVHNNSYFNCDDMSYKVRLDKGNYDDYLWVRGENNVKNLLFELNEVISKHLHKEGEKANGILFHITMPSVGHFRNLTCIRLDADTEINISYDKCIWFKEEKMAVEVLHEIKSCVYEFFHSSDEGEAGKDYPDWINEKWRDDCQCKKCITRKTT